MRAVIQRVKEASVAVDGKTIGQCESGYLIFLGVGHTDTEEICQKLWNKIWKMRICADNAGKTNLSLKDIEGQALIISQFTLYANSRKGNRPSFTEAAPAQKGRELYEKFLDCASRDCCHVEHGEFGADMQVSLVNDGPFTIVLDTDELFGPKDNK